MTGAGSVGLVDDAAVDRERHVPDAAHVHVAGRQVGMHDLGPLLGDDELVEVTPKSIRLRKILLDPIERKRLRSKDAA